MRWIIDVVLIGILLVAVFTSAKKGIVRTVLEIGAFVLSLVLAAQIAAPMAKTFYSSFLSERIEDKIEDTLSQGEAATNTKKADVVLDSLPDFAKNYLEKAGVQSASLASDIANQAPTGNDTAAFLNEKIARPICETVLTGILFLLFCLVLGAVFQWAAGGISKLFSLPIVGTANKFLGGVFGAIKGCVIIYIAVALLVFIAPRQNSGGQLQEAVNNSSVVAFTQQYLPNSVFGEWL